jgi:hypothetical protein
VLADVATDLGLDAEVLRSALGSGRYAERHDKALLRARELDITAVPTFPSATGGWRACPPPRGCAGCSTADGRLTRRSARPGRRDRIRERRRASAWTADRDRTRSASAGAAGVRQGTRGSRALMAALG